MLIKDNNPMSSLESRNKISIKKKGVKINPEFTRSGWHHTEEARSKISNSRIGMVSPNKGKKCLKNKNKK